MASFTWVCFACRTAVRRPRTARTPRCAACREECTFLGEKIPVPAKSKTRKWDELRTWLYARKLEMQLRHQRRQVARIHELEREITKLQLLPSNAGRDSALAKVHASLSFAQGHQRPRQGIRLRTYKFSFQGT